MGNRKSTSLPLVGFDTAPADSRSTASSFVPSTSLFTKGLVRRKNARLFGKEDTRLQTAVARFAERVWTRRALRDEFSFNIHRGDDHDHDATDDATDDANDADVCFLNATLLPYLFEPSPAPRRIWVRRWPSSRRRRGGGWRVTNERSGASATRLVDTEHRRVDSTCFIVVLDGARLETRGRDAAGRV